MVLLFHRHCNLTGLVSISTLATAFNPQPHFCFDVTGVDRVILIDRMRPASYDCILAAVLDVAPWVSDKVTFLKADLNGVKADSADVAGHIQTANAATESSTEHRGQWNIPKNSAFLSIHACNEATDLSIAIALNYGAAAVACMPCCYYSQPVMGGQVPVLKQVHM